MPHQNFDVRPCSRSTSRAEKFDFDFEVKNFSEIRLDMFSRNLTEKVIYAIRRRRRHEILTTFQLIFPNNPLESS